MQKTIVKIVKQNEVIYRYNFKCEHVKGIGPRIQFTQQ